MKAKGEGFRELDPEQELKSLPGHRSLLMVNPLCSTSHHPSQPST